MTKVDTYTATIYVGLYDVEHKIRQDINVVYKLCQEYVESADLCVTVTPTRFIYGHRDQLDLAGWEDGAVVGLINYPRSATPCDKIKEHAFALASLLKNKFNQKRLSIVFSDETWMLE